MVHPNELVIPKVTKEDLREIYYRIGDNKASGLHGSTNRALKLALKTRPDLCANIFERTFPAQWKKTKIRGASITK